jgi:hypothetical protein
LFRDASSGPFVPTYALFGGWSGLALYQVLTGLCMVYLFVPRAKPLGRAVSLAFLLAHLYQMTFVPFPYPGTGRRLLCWALLFSVSGCNT